MVVYTYPYEYVSCARALRVFFTSTVIHASEYNAGFVEGLWYSKEPVFAGETTRLYVALRNNTGSDMTGRVVFYDNDERLTSVSVSALDGRIIEAWTDWTPTVGDHELRAELTSVKLDSITGRDEEITVPYGAVRDSLYVDRDTDGDGVGNQDDSDDDNDGVDDAEEVENGTDPLVADLQDESDKSNETKTESDTTLEEVSDAFDLAVGNNREGLEQYIGSGPIHDGLESLTELMLTTQASLDSYRSARMAERSQPSSGSRLAATSSDATTIGSSQEQPEKLSNFGQITRTLTSEREEQNWLDRAQNFILTNMSNLYGGILLILSSGLGRPLLLQLLLLIFILFFIYKLARRLGGRKR